MAIGLAVRHKYVIKPVYILAPLTLMPVGVLLIFHNGGGLCITHVVNEHFMMVITYKEIFFIRRSTFRHNHTHRKGRVMQYATIERSPIVNDWYSPKAYSWIVNSSLFDGFFRQPLAPYLITIHHQHHVRIRCKLVDGFAVCALERIHALVPNQFAPCPLLGNSV